MESLGVQLNLNENDKIPKVIHVSWTDKSILDSKHPLVTSGIGNLIRLNPNWEVQVSDDNDVNRYLKQHLSTYDYLKIFNKKIVEKIDLWRLLKLYNEGGIYTDIDRLWNQKLDEIIDSETKCVLPTYEDVDFSHSLMISVPNNPIFKQAIADNLSKRYWLNLRGVFHLGPPLYMRSVTKSIFGKSISRRPGRVIMENFRESLHHSVDFQTYREIHPFDTFTYRSNTSEPFNFKDTKADFYRSFKVSTWNKGADKNSIILFSLIVIITVITFLILK